MMARKNHGSFMYNILICLVMEVLTYLVGLPWLKIYLSTSWAKALTAGLVPFLIGDTVKILVASGAAKALYPEVMKLSVKLDEREKEE